MKQQLLLMAVLLVLPGCHSGEPSWKEVQISGSVGVPRRVLIKGKEFCRTVGEETFAIPQEHQALFGEMAKFNDRLEDARRRGDKLDDPVHQFRDTFPDIILQALTPDGWLDCIYMAAEPVGPRPERRLRFSGSVPDTHAGIPMRQAKLYVDNRACPNGVLACGQLEIPLAKDYVGSFSVYCPTKLEDSDLKLNGKVIGKLERPKESHEGIYYLVDVSGKRTYVSEYVYYGPPGKPMRITLGPGHLHRCGSVTYFLTSIPAEGPLGSHRAILDAK